MEFCIWGCGKRGKNVYRFMRGKKVCAFIDSNPKFQGGSYKNIPIISFDTYLEQYRNCVVIVTPHVGAQEIEQLLYQHNVTYLSSEVLPQEITDEERQLIYTDSIFSASACWIISWNGRPAR